MPSNFCVTGRSTSKSLKFFVVGGSELKSHIKGVLGRVENVLLILFATHVNISQHLLLEYTPAQKLSDCRGKNDSITKKCLREKMTSVFSRPPQTVRVGDSSPHFYLSCARDKIPKLVYLLCRVCCTHAKGPTIVMVPDHHVPLLYACATSHTSVTHSN